MYSNNAPDLTGTAYHSSASALHLLILTDRLLITLLAVELCAALFPLSSESPCWQLRTSYNFAAVERSMMQLLSWILTKAQLFFSFSFSFFFFFFFPLFFSSVSRIWTWRFRWRQKRSYII